MTGDMATILNVDDQEPGRYARRRMLERAGYRVIDANCFAGCAANVSRRAFKLHFDSIASPVYAREGNDA